MDVSRIAKQQYSESNEEIVQKLNALENEIRTLRYEIIQSGIIPHHAKSPFKNAQEGISALINMDLDEIRHRQHISQDSLLSFAEGKKNIEWQKELSRPFFTSLDSIDILRLFDHPTLPKRTKLDRYLLGLGKDLKVRRVEKNITPQKNNIKKADFETAFRFHDGTSIHSLEELYHYLCNASEETFYRHVNNKQNDFAMWTKEILHAKHLARTMTLAKTREEFLDILSKAINR